MMVGGLAFALLLGFVPCRATQDQAPIAARLTETATREKKGAPPGRSSRLTKRPPAAGATAEEKPRRSDNEDGAGGLRARRASGDSTFHFTDP